MYLSFCSWLISGYIIQYSTSSQNPTLHNYLLVVTSGRVMELVISESDQNLKKHAFIMYSTYFKRLLYTGFLLSLGSGMGAGNPSLQEPDTFQRKLTKCHQAPIVQAMASSLKRLSHLCHLSLFALVSWAAGSTSAQPMPSRPQ